ncbi:MAG TPA: pullulanase-type alpha-1,6-glucosidase [Vicinamibacteria bacterium]|nr:pullulanase-type alpha-1,6-glucosidase [Vicinamibacteria bacterium]
MRRVSGFALLIAALSSGPARLMRAKAASPAADLGLARAHWVDEDTILWPAPVKAGARYALHHSPRGALHVDSRGLAGGQSLALHPAGPASDELRRRFPHLGALPAFRVEVADQARLRAILKEQLAVSAYGRDGHLLDATSVQIPGVIDDLYRYDGPLGVSLSGGVPTLRLWAPTARSVTVHLADGPATAWKAAEAMRPDATTGVWTAVGRPDWYGKYYAYDVEVYAPASGRVELNRVSDPWSVSLSANGRRSQIVDLDDPALKPSGWDALRKPPLEAFEDAVVYELHVRDFSIRDATVPEPDRGTFKAFAHSESAGMRHLRALAEAGLTHLHLLPAFDFATVNETRSEREEPDWDALAALAGHSEEQAALVEPLKAKDGFNWGYDPLHYTVPEGSYASDPDGPARILEFREMVQALNESGLRVVLDVVYNHTHAHGQDPQSVLDRIVPGYYHRLNGEGRVENSTCCSNTASEHAMMEKLMVDSVTTWARAYKVDGFRFDLMGHHLVANMQRVRRALDDLEPGRDGVDGKRIYVYGEAWDFGEVGGGARGANASQTNVGGTGLGAFNDRLRDAARGGGAFSGLQEQGFLTGLFDDPNGTPQGSLEDQRAKLLRYMDWIRIGLAGNLRDYRFTLADGRLASGAEIDYGGRPAGYALDPQENVVYVSAHDNETLFDAIQLRAAATASIADRVRMQKLGLSLVLLAQGVPFVHAGDDILRSKSLDRNSYDSGDWWNAIDWSYATNGWAKGLPPGENRRHWPVMAPLLADPRLRAGRAEILDCAEHFREMLRVRRSSRLFRLRRVDEVQRRLRFANTGPDQVPGVIVFTLDNAGDDRVDDPYAAILAVLNARRVPFESTEEALKGVAFRLHPVLAGSADASTRASRFDAATGRVSVPARTTAVFVLPAG